MTSPVEFEEFESESILLGDLTQDQDQIHDEEEDGEELFGDNMEA